MIIRIILQAQLSLGLYKDILILANIFSVPFIVTLNIAYTYSTNVIRWVNMSTHSCKPKIFLQPGITGLDPILLTAFPFMNYSGVPNPILVDMI